MKGVRTYVATPIVDQTDEAAHRTILAELITLDRPSGKRVFLRVAIDAEDASTSSINLEPEQARRLADVLEHGADLADKEPVKLVAALVEQLAYYHGENLEPVLERARAWLERHGKDDDK